MTAIERSGSKVYRSAILSFRRRRATPRARPDGQSDFARWKRSFRDCAVVASTWKSLYLFLGTSACVGCFYQTRPKYFFCSVAIRLIP